MEAARSQSQSPELAHSHLHSILLVKASYKTSPDSGGEKIDSTSGWERLLASVFVDSQPKTLNSGVTSFYTLHTFRGLLKPTTKEVCKRVLVIPTEDQGQGVCVSMITY